MLFSLRALSKRFMLPAAFISAVTLAPGTAASDPRGYHIVTGVEADDMLKMRAGAGVGYKIVLGLPNGTKVWVYQCKPSGNTSWCRVALDGASSFKGYVSLAYLRKK